MEDIDLACKDALNGIPSRRPIIEMTIPSVLDRTISPPGMAKFAGIISLICALSACLDLD